MKKSENYLEKKPCRSSTIVWSEAEGIVTLEIENKGLMNRIFQVILKKPKVSYIHLDELGSFVWKLMDGNRDILSIGKDVKEHFGEACEPLYERLSTFIKTMESYGFLQ